MPKTLILFRHAKSSWEENVEDHDRPLADRGRKASPLMARWLVEEKLIPALTLVSTSRRTQETWTLLSSEIGKMQKRDNADIYEAPAGRILDVIHGVEPSVDRLMVVGHNPGLEDLAALLMKDDGGEAGSRLTRKFPTAAIAVLALPIDDWTELAPGIASLEQFVSPKFIK